MIQQKTIVHLCTIFFLFFCNLLAIPIGRDLYPSMQDLGTNFWLHHDYYDYNNYNGYNGLTSMMKNLLRRWIWVCF
jgi:hypothetical protein